MNIRTIVLTLAALFAVVAVCFAAGEMDAMFEALERAHRQRDYYLLQIQNLPFFDRYRFDPRYQALLQKMNLA